MAYQSLYRRYRPRRFDEVRGQEHLVSALRNAVREDRVGHAYLFSGPRGTGKTSTARILAKVLNCENPTDGEPCGECESCLAIDSGTSFDVHELDAASNNGVDAVRDLIAKASLGTPGRTKVYILDEVHMLSTAASNALLKTLEEPPEHVVFVLATTDPQKVLPTIRSRTQHFEVHLLPAADLESLVDDVCADAGLDVSDEERAYVLRAGGGSARDTLSALDRVVAAGGVPDDAEAVDELVEALCERDTGRALVAVEAALVRGRSPRVLGESLIARLRDVFLAAVGADLARLPEAERARAADQAARLGPAGATRALETLGEAFVGIQDALDPRIPLEVALVRLTRPDADTSPGALAERVARLEQAMASGTPAAPPAGRAPAPARPPVSSPAATSETATPATDAATPSEPPGPSPATEQAPPAPAGGARPADGAREVLARRRGESRTTAERPPARPAPARKGPTRPTPGSARGPGAAGGEAPAEPATPEPAAAEPATAPPAAEGTDAVAPDGPAPAPSPAPPAAGGSGLPSRDELTLAWGDSVMASLPQRAKVRFAGGHWVGVEDDVALFGLPNPVHASRCEECRGEVEDALRAHFGRPVPIRLVVDAGDPPPSSGGAPEPSPTPPEDEVIDPAELTDATDVASSGLDRIAAVFPGAELVDDEPA